MLRILRQNLGRTLAAPFNSLTWMTFETAVSFNLRQLRFLTFISGAPFGIKDEAVFVDTTWFKRLFWTVSLGVVWLRSCVVATGLSLSLTFDRFWNPMFLPLYMGILACCLCASFIGYSVLTCEPGSFATTWNFILKRRSTAKAPKLLVCFMCTFTSSAYVCALALNLLFALNPQLVIQFRFAVTWALEEGLLTSGPIYGALVVISTVADFWSFNVVLGVSCNVAVAQMIMLETWAGSMNHLLDSCKEGPPNGGLKHVRQTLEELVTANQIFNICNSGAIFSVKLICLVLSVSYTSAVLIVDYTGNPLFHIISWYSAFVGSIGYPSFYHRAYSVSTGLERAKLELLKFRQLDRRLQAISPRGVQVGSFYNFERESDPDLIYWNFIVNQVISIVLV